MFKYKIEIRMDVIIEAESLQEAKDKALEKAWNDEITYHAWIGQSHAVKDEENDTWDYAVAKP